MVRFASRSILDFHWPFTQWYWPLNMGSPQFLHYQGLAATITGFFGAIIGPNTAFRLSLYLLYALWPLAIYFSARTFGLEKSSSLGAALVASFLSNATHVGYEARAYEWLGYGVWAQLCASWTLPFAWAWTWRALRESRHAWKAVFFIALTASLHYETGYSAFAALIIFPFILPSDLRRRLMNAGLMLVSALAASSWVIVPLLVYAKWASINPTQANSPFGRGYGAGQNLSWLFHGQYFDAGRFPILSVMVLLAFVAIAFRWRRDPLGRVFAVLMVFFFLLSWGPATWGALTDAIPGHADIFFRRFLLSVDLSSLYAIGFGISWLGGVLSAPLRRLVTKVRLRKIGGLGITDFALITSMCLTLIVVAVAFPSDYDYQNRNAQSVGFQLRTEQPNVQYISPIISYLKTANNGRVYAGLSSNWGHTFVFGAGPMYMYLADNDVAQVSTPGWAASLMEAPESQFDPNNISDYVLFGCRYLLLPTGMKTPVPAQLLLTSGPYQLWQIPNIGYFSIDLVSGSVDENKESIAAQDGLVMRTQYIAQFVELRVNYGTSNLAVVYPSQRPQGPIGTVLSDHINLTNGEASGTFELRRPGNVVLAASFDPGWQAFVDGNLVPTQMLAPAVVSVPVPAGVHTVIFRYQGFRWYLPLFLLAIAGICFAIYVPRRSTRQGAATHDDDADAET
jgi:hypothetical protein